MSRESFLFFLGDKLSANIKNVIEEGRALTPKEILVETGLVAEMESETPRMKEVLMPSEDDRPEKEFVDVGGISVPSSSVFYLEWPRKTDLSDLRVSMHCHSIGMRKEFWATIRKSENDFFVFFECVRDDILPWSEINIIPERKIENEIVQEFEKFLDENFPSENVFVSDPIRQGAIICNYTINFKNNANTITDVGMNHQLSVFLFEFFDRVLTENLWIYANGIVRKLETKVKPNLKNFLPVCFLADDPKLL